MHVDVNQNALWGEVRFLHLCQIESVAKVRTS